MPDITLQDADVSAYTSHLFDFLRWGNEKIELLNTGPLHRFAELLDFKAQHNLAGSLHICAESGMPTFLEYCGIISEIKQRELLAQTSFKLPELRERLISQCDSGEITQQFVSETLEKVARRSYFDMLSQAEADLQTHPKPAVTLLEQGKESNLVHIYLFRFSQTLATFVAYDIEVNVKNHRLGFRNMVSFDGGNARLSGKITSILDTLFDSESNVAFHYLSENSELTPRKVVRTVFGPYYTPHTLPNPAFKQVDLFHNGITDFFAGGSVKCYALAIHRDESTRNLAPSSNTRDETMESILSLEKYYLTRDEPAAAFLRQLLPTGEKVTVLRYGE